MPIKTKTSMTSFDVSAVVSELSSSIGARVYNIYDAPAGIVLRLKSPGRDARIVAEPGKRIHYTAYELKRDTPSTLVMAFRKYIRGCVLSGVSQLGFDRIAKLSFRCPEERFIVVEVLPRGVLALLDSEGKILHATEYREMRDRAIKRLHPYTPPPPPPLTPEELPSAVERLRPALQRSGSAASVLARATSMPGEVVEEALARCGVKPDSDAQQAADAVECFAEQVASIYRESRSGGRGFVLRGGDTLVTAVPFEPKGLVELYGYEVSVFGSFSEALDVYFGEGLKSSVSRRESSALEAERARLQASIERALENAENIRARIRELEEDAKAIAENIVAVEQAVRCAQRVREEAGWDFVAGSCPGVADADPSSGRILVNAGGRLVWVDVRYDPSGYIVELYKRIGEYRGKLERVMKAVEELKERVARLQEETVKVAAAARASVRKRRWYEKFHWMYTTNYVLAVGGRDASQNESVVKRYLTDSRIFMHADVHGAPAVVLFVEGSDPDPRDLLDAATLAACYSRAWKQGVGSVDVYWVWGSQVSKSPPPGEYISKGAFMVYGKRNYIRGVQMKLAVGVSVAGEEPLVVVGPDELVRRRSIAYAVLVPGDEDPSKLALRLKRTLPAKAPPELKPYVEAVTVEELRLRIPGRSKVIYLGRGEGVEPPTPGGGVHRQEAEKS
jgi:predicted ribosome quality control (RQC) complex YloA/Tae2 family protein